MRGFLSGINGEYSELQVMQSNAGYYIGTIFVHGKYAEFPGMQEPGRRESEYFATRQEAQTALEENNWNQRMHP